MPGSGGATLLQPTDSESKRLFGEAFAVACVRMTYQQYYRTAAVEDFDQTLSKCVLCNKNHVLHCLLRDDRPDLPYTACATEDISGNERSLNLTSCNFISRLLLQMCTNFTGRCSGATGRASD